MKLLNTLKNPLQYGLIKLMPGVVKDVKDKLAIEVLTKIKGVIMKEDEEAPKKVEVEKTETKEAPKKAKKAKK